MYLSPSDSFGGGLALSQPRLAPPLTRHARFALVVDLGEAIGSARWWRGLVTLLALLALTWALRPAMAPLPVRAPTQLGDATTVVGSLRSGSRTGRRMIATDAVQPLLDAPERPRLDLTAAVAVDEPLAAALSRAGVGAAEAARVALLVAGASGSNRVNPGTVLTITLGARSSRLQARPLENLRFRARFDLALSVTRADNGFVVRTLPVAVDAAPLRVTGTVSDGIFVTATAAGAPAEAVQTYLRTIAGAVPLGIIEPGARYDLIVERQRAATGEVRFGKLLFAGLTQSSGTTQMIEWTVGGRSGWFDANGVARQQVSEFVAPVNGRKTSGFGWRVHPLLRYSRFHKGVDYGAYHGSPIRAAADGIVIFAGWHGGHGKMVKLGHGGALGSGYAHMSRIAVAPGERVTQGQVIGYVGSTGLSTGPHLHFEVYRNGIAVDPAGVSFASRPLLSGAELAAFRARIAQLTALR